MIHCNVCTTQAGWTDLLTWTLWKLLRDHRSEARVENHRSLSNDRSLHHQSTAVIVHYHNQHTTTSFQLVGTSRGEPCTLVCQMFFNGFYVILSHIIRIRVMPPWHPWAFCRIQDGVQDGGSRNGNYWNDHIFFVIAPRNVLLVSIYMFCHPRNMKKWVSIGFGNAKQKMAANMQIKAAITKIPFFWP